MKKILTTINKTEPIKQVKTINKELVVNGGDLDAYIELLIDGEKILEKKADSYVSNYIVALYLMMGNVNSLGMPAIYREKTFQNITNVSSGTGGVIRLTMATIGGGTGSGKVAVGGVGGITIDGIYDYNYISSTQIDLVGTTYGAGWTSNTGCAILYESTTAIVSAPENLRSPAIYVGSGTTATTINDFSLEKPIPNRTTVGGLTYNATTIVSEDTTDATSAQVTLTRTFVNQTGSTTTVNELGVFAAIGTSTAANRSLLIRDIISGGVAVANGKTLTINYRLKTSLSAGTNPGGFTQNFAKFMYRQLNNTSRPITAIDNIAYSIPGSAVQMEVISSGGYNVPLSSISGALNQPGWSRGIVVGTGTTSTSMTDYFLETPVEHGVSSGKMLYYGGFVESYVVGANYAQFTVYKTIENSSGASITINEIGITGCCRDENSAPHQFPHKYALIARNILTSPVTVANNEILKVAYTIKVVV